MKHKLQKFFISRFLDRKAENIEKNVFFILFSLVGMVFGFVFSILNLIQGHFIQGGVELIAGMGIGVNLIYFQNRKNIQSASSILLFFMILLLIGALYTGGVNGYGIYWFFTFPVLAFFLKEKSSGAFWFGILITLSLTAAVLSWLIPSFNLFYRPFEVVFMLVSLLVTGIMIYVYELIRGRYTKLLSERQDFYKQIFETNKAVKLLIEPETGKIADANQAACEFYGYTKNEILSKNISQINVLSREGIREEMEKAKNEDRLYFNFQHKTAWGELRDVEVYSGPVDLMGKTYLYSIIHDITERKNTENFLKKLKRAVEEASHSFYITNVRGEIEYINPAFEALTGYSSREVLGKTPTIMNSGSMSNEYFKKLWDSILSGQVWDEEIINQKKNGELYYAHQKISPIHDEKGSITHFVAIQTDITEKVKTLKQQEILSEVSLIFNSLTDFEDKMNLTLSLLGNHMEVSRVYVFEDNPDNTTSNTYEWTNEGIEPQINELQNIPYEIIPSWKSILKQRNMLYSENIAELPGDIREILEPQNIKSILVLPLYIAGEFFGFIGFDECVRERNWTSSEITLLKTISNILSNAYQRKITSRALAESEERFRLISENMRDMISLHSLDGTYLYVSPSVKTLLGYEPEELMGTNPYDLFHPEDQERIRRKSHERAAQDLMDTRIEYRIRRKDGTYTWFETLTKPIVNEKGELVSLHTSSRDITIRKEAELQLQKLTGEYETILNNTDEAIFLIDVNEQDVFRFKRLNRTHEKLTGLTTPQVRGKTPRELLGEELGAMVEQNYRRCFESRKTITYEEELPLPAGIRIWSTRLSPVFSEGRITQIVGSARDITEAKKAEEARARLASIVETSEDAIVGKSLDGVIQTWNTGAVKLYGYTAKEAVGQPIFLIVPEDKIQDVKNHMSAIKSGKTLEHIQTERVRKDGKRIPISLTLSPIKDADGNIIGISAIGRDISLQKQAERELREARKAAEEASRAKSQFLANMSHEIRTPMNGILGLTQYVLESELTQSQRNNLEMIYSSGNTLLEIINDILDFSKIESGKMKISPTDFSMQSMIQTLVSTLHVTTRKKGIGLEFDLDESLPEYLFGDPVRINQILLNLTGNAVKFTSEGEVRVRIRKIDQNEAPDEVKSAVDNNAIWTEFQVVDTGIGIPPDKLESIFESFVQADESHTREFGGTGLGLSISKQLVDLMQGTMKVESVPGEGSIFSFILPLKPGEEPKKEHTFSTQVIATPPLKILVAEDYPVNQQVILRFLEKNQHTAQIAENGEEVLSFLKEGFYDLVLMDIQMPVLDGIQATRMIREGQAGKSNKTIPIIALSAHALEEEKEAFSQVGFDDYLTKPIDYKKLLAALSAVYHSKPITYSSSESATSDVFDPVFALNLLAGEKELLKMAVKTMTETAPGDFERLKQWIKDKNFGEIQRKAHSLKSGFLMIGGKEAGNLAQEMEKAGEEKDLPKISSLLPSLKEAFEKLMGELRKTEYLS
jgi:PAS domain S-box-containing protein